MVDTDWEPVEGELHSWAVWAYIVRTDYFKKNNFMSESDLAGEDDDMMFD